MIDDPVIEARIQRAVATVVVPDVPLGARRSGKRVRGIQPFLAVASSVIILVAAVVTAHALGEFRAGLAAASASSAAGARQVSVTRNDAISLVKSLHENVGRIDRIEARLVTWDEYLRIMGNQQTLPGDPLATPSSSGVLGFTGDARRIYFWAVAVSGEVWPQFRMPISWGSPISNPTPYPPYRWGIFLVDAARGGLAAITAAGVGADWPAAFDQLPDHVLATVPAPSPAARPGQQLNLELGSVGIDMTEGDVLHARGTPSERRALSDGGIQLIYGDDLVVFLRPDPTVSSPHVWRILAQPPFSGGSAEGFALGQTSADFRHAYGDFVVVELGANELVARDSDGDTVTALFVDDHATSLTLQKP